MNLNLKEKLALRLRVLTYLEAMKLTADNTLGLDNLDDKQWDDACKDYFSACKNLREARFGSNWMKHIEDAKANGF